MTTPTIPNALPVVVPVIDVGIGDRYDAAAVAGIWGTGPGDPLAARWSTPGDANEWGGNEPLWNDIACEVLECSTFTGRDGSVEKFNVGTATIVVRNLDGWADFRPPADPDNVLTIRPGRQIRVGVQVDGAATQWLWRGVIDVTEPGYRPGEGDIVTLGCIDAKGDVGRGRLPTTAAPVGDGDKGYQRVARTLNAAGWPAARRRLDVDTVAMLATEYGSQVADELDRTAESVSGHVYGDLAGRVVFRRRDWMTWPGTTPVTATIGNVGAGDVCPAGWEQRFGRDDLTTVAIVGRPGETPIIQTSAEAYGLYGYEPWERGDLLPADTFELSRVASRVRTARSPSTMPRVAAVILDAATGDGDVAPVMAAVSPFTPTRLRCRHRRATGELAFDRTMMVVGVTHTVSPVDGWTCRIALDDALPYRNVDNPARWDDANTKWSSDDQWAMSL